MDALRHVAKIANTDQRCVVVWMQIPNREDHALVVPIDNLPPRLEQAVMDVVQSQEGQNEETLAYALSRNLMPDTGDDILKTLHTNNRLVAVPIQQVLMMPRPNQPVKLSSILEQLGRLPDQQTQGLMEDYAVNKFNPHANNQQATATEQNRNIARNLLVEAEMLEADAKRKRDQAYNFDASLRNDNKGKSQRLDWFPESVAIPEPEKVSEPEPAPVPSVDLLSMMQTLLERVEAQDKLLVELQSKSDGKQRRARPSQASDEASN